MRKITLSIAAVVVVLGLTSVSTLPASAVNGVRVVKGTNYVNGI